jgi:YHS domain-containing protein
MTGYTAALAPDLGGVLYESHGRKVLRTSVSRPRSSPPFAGASRHRGRLPVDPVCRMAVEPDRAAGRLTDEGTAYFFCTLTCAGEFAREPERFT